MTNNIRIRIIRRRCKRNRRDVRIQSQGVIVMNVMTGFGTGKELKITVMARFKARSKGRMEWSTMMESM